MKQVSISQFQFNFLIFALLLATVFLVIVIGPFATTLLLAMILVTGVYPLYNKLVVKLHGRKSLAALITSLAIALLFSGPFILFLILLSQEGVATYRAIEAFVMEGRFNMDEIFAWLSSHLGMSPQEITSSITQAVQNLSGFLVEQSTNVLKSIVMLLFNFFLLVFSMYFFFKDGPRLIEATKKMIPLPTKYEDEIFVKFKEVSTAMLYGIFLTAILQGILGGVGLSVAGVENSLFWGTVMGILGMLPVGGTAIVWLPAAIILIATGHPIAGVGLLIWGALIVGLIDNFVKPMLIQKEANTYPLATFLVVIGGLMVFGLN